MPEPVDIFVGRLADDLLPRLASALRHDGNGFQSPTLLMLGEIIEELAQMMRDELAMEKRGGQA